MRRGSLSYLDDGALAGDLEDLALSDGAVTESHVHDLSVPRRRSSDEAGLTWGT